MKKERKVSNTGVKFQDDQHIGEVEIVGYKYLGILELDQTLNTRIKDNITTISGDISISRRVYQSLSDKSISDKSISRELRNCVNLN